MVVIVQGHDFILPMSFITFHRFACRINRSRWPVEPHTLYDIDGKF